MDTRARAVLAEVRATVGGADLAGELANPVVLGSSLPPLVWLARFEPDALRRATWFLGAKDWLRLRMTGEVGAEATDASATLLFDVRRAALVDRDVRRVRDPGPRCCRRSGRAAPAPAA